MGSSLAPFLALAIIDCIFVTMNLAFCHILFYSTQQLIHLFSSQEWGLQQICHCLFVTSHNMSMVRVFTLSCLASQYTFYLHCQTVYAPHWLTSSEYHCCQRCIWIYHSSGLKCVLLCEQLRTTPFLHLHPAPVHERLLLGRRSQHCLASTSPRNAAPRCWSHLQRQRPCNLFKWRWRCLEF